MRSGADSGADMDVSQSESDNIAIPTTSHFFPLYKVVSDRYKSIANSSTKWG